MRRLRTEFELFQSITEPVKKKCPKCGKLKLRRLFGTGAAVVFKGSGFYQTDYRSESYKKGAEKDKPASESKTESKSESKSESNQKHRLTADSKPQEREEIDEEEVAGGGQRPRSIEWPNTSTFVTFRNTALRRGYSSRPMCCRCSACCFLAGTHFRSSPLYWVENVIIGAINVLKMITCDPDLKQIANHWAGLVPAANADEIRKSLDKLKSDVRLACTTARRFL